ncbi:MAG TPA: hypothetical protein PLP48_00365 [Acholeplasmataceae bacterium]|nr:hypothetical protein [Acholeplasmataceae bacterium]
MATTKKTKSDVGLKEKTINIFSYESEQTMIQHHFELMDRISEYKRITTSIRSNMTNIFDYYLSIGRWLNKIDDNKLYEVGEYASVLEYAKSEFDLSTTTTRNVMAIVKRFCDEDGYLLDEYKGMNFSTLIELLPVEGDDLKMFTPTMTVKEMRMRKVEIEINHILEEVTSEKGLFTRCVDAIHMFDYDKFFGISGFDITHQVNKEKFEYETYSSYGRTFVVAKFEIKNPNIKRLKIEFAFRMDSKAFCFFSQNLYFGQPLEYPFSDDQFIAYYKKQVLERLKCEVADKVEAMKLKGEPKRYAIPVMDVPLIRYPSSNPSCSVIRGLIEEKDQKKMFINIDDKEQKMHIYIEEPKDKNAVPDVTILNHHDLTSLKVLDSKGQLVLSGKDILHTYQSVLEVLLIKE